MNNFLGKIKKEWLVLIGFLVLFVVVRLPAFHIPYHQDEYKWPLYAEAKEIAPGSIPHPPLTEFIYRIVASHLNLNDFRLIPLFFGLINFFLILYLAKIIFDRKSALWTAFLFVISFYSVLASLMVDVDGAVMPFFFLLMSIAYVKLKNFDFRWSKESRKWFMVLLISLVGGFMIKVSFLVGVAALALDFALYKNVFSDRGRLLKYATWSGIMVGGLVLILIGAKFIFPFFNLGKALKYWEHFAVFAGRGWGQTFIQFAKAFLYTSPLLVLPAMLVDRDIWIKSRPFFFFLGIGTFFYLFAFDFSLGAIDRYFQFVVVPLCLISGAVMAKYLPTINNRQKIRVVVISVLAGLLIFITQFFKQSVPPLYPKSEWLSRVFSLDWNFLFPFSGGSGPIGFYISFAFIALAWIASILALIMFWQNKNKRPIVLLWVLVLGLVYNGIFIEEYLWGRINGSASRLTISATTVIKDDPNITKVMVYNDNGGYLIKQTGKYVRRIYAVPAFEEEYKKIFSNFDGHILYVNTPRIYQGGLYARYFASCGVSYEQKDKYVTAQILDCRKKIN